MDQSLVFNVISIDYEIIIIESILYISLEHVLSKTKMKARMGNTYNYISIGNIRI